VTKKEYVSQEYSRETKGKNLREGTRATRAMTIGVTGFFSFALIVGIGLISFAIVFFFSEVQGTSMMKTINAKYLDTDSVIVNRYKEPKRGDIIVIKHHDANGNFKEYHIKRLIALGGESVHFRLSDDKTRYIIEVDGVAHDNHLYQLDFELGQNKRNAHYDSFYNYQQTQKLPGSFLATDYDRVKYNNPAFRTSYREGGEEIQFLQFNTERARWEFKLPKGYIFYMGDNRGGSGDGFDFRMMSIDSTYYGPVPESRIAGTVTEIIHEKKASGWAWDKFVWAITFKWAKK